MCTEYIDIDECQAELWQRVYAAIVCIANHKGFIDKELKLSDSISLETLSVSSDGIISLHDVYGNIGIAEDFDDEMLFEAYRSLHSILPQ